MSQNPLADRGIALRLLDGPLVRRLGRPSLLSSVCGRIDRLLLTIPSWILRYQHQPEVRPMAHAIRSVIREFPDYTSFLIVTQAEGETALSSWLDEFGLGERAEVVTTPDKMRFGSWAQDGSVVCEDEADGRLYLVEPVPYRTVEDGHIPGLVAAREGAERTQAPLSFQGGNILVGDDFWLLGMDSAVETMKLGLATAPEGTPLREAVDGVFADRLDARRTLHLVGSRIPVPGFPKHSFTKKVTVEGQVWKDVSYRGNSPGTAQPIFHIDAFLTLAGRNQEGSPVVLVGDPGLASELLGRPPLPQEMTPVFDDIAEQLGILGFDVVRNPLPLVYHDDEVGRVRSWYFATANNALVEIDGSRKRVWIPTYGGEGHPELEATDTANGQIWEGLGFEVTLLGDFNNFARELGAAHCITKCLARGECSDPA